MSNSLRLLRLAAVAGLSFAAGFGVARQQPQARAANVNGEDISVAELRRELEIRFGPDVLRDLVHQKLILQEAKKQSVASDPKLLESRLKEMTAQPQVQAMLKSGEVSEADLRRNLSTLVPLDQLVQKEIDLAAEADYLKQHREELESIEVEHILLADLGSAEKVRALATAPKADFAALAKQHSLDQESAQRGGKLGVLHRSELDPEVAQVLFELETGKISEPLEGGNGIHPFRVVARATSLEDLRPKIRELMVAAKRGEYLEDLRGSARVQCFPPYHLPATLKAEESPH